MTKDLVSKYQDPDRAHVVDQMSATYCAFVRDAEGISGKEKAQMWAEFTKGIFAFMSNQATTGSDKVKNTPIKPKPKPQSSPSPSQGVSRPTALAPTSPIVDTKALPAPSAVSEGLGTPASALLWNPPLEMQLDGVGNAGTVWSVLFQAKSTSFVKLRDAYIASKITGRKEKLSIYTPLVMSPKMDLDEIETIPPNAQFRLGYKWEPHLSLQSFMEQWSEMEVVVVYNDNQRYVQNFNADYFRQFIAGQIPGAFSPEIKRKSAAP